jgi:hypothetical protein
VVPDVSEEHIASIFRVEEITSARNQQEKKFRKRQVSTKIDLTLIYACINK